MIQLQIIEFYNTLCYDSPKSQHLQSIAKVALPRGQNLVDLIYPRETDYRCKIVTLETDLIDVAVSMHGTISPNAKKNGYRIFGITPHLPEDYCELIPSGLFVQFDSADCKL